MPIGHEPWIPSPSLRIELATTGTCFTVTVDHTSPSAIALYRLATNQTLLKPIIHIPNGSTSLDIVLHRQPFLVTTNPGKPLAATGPRITVACPAFIQRTQPKLAAQALRETFRLSWTSLTPFNHPLRETR